MKWFLRSTNVWTKIVVLFRNKKNHARFLGTTGGGSAGTRKNYAVKIYRFISQLRKIIYTSNESTCIETTGKPGGVV